MAKEETVTIAKEEYDYLKESELFLTILTIWGVEKWRFYGNARRAYREIDLEGDRVW